MKYKNTVQVRRIVWGDYEPRFVGEVDSLESHLKLIKRDRYQRIGEEDRIRIYSFRTKDREMVAYGLSDDLEKSIKEFWEGD